METDGSESYKTTMDNNNDNAQNDECGSLKLNLLPSVSGDDNDKILSLDDDDLDEKEQDTNSTMLDVVKAQIVVQGWAQVSVAMIKQKCDDLVIGYARQELATEYILPSEVVGLLRMYFPTSKLNVFCWDNKYLTIQSGGECPSIYVVKKVHWKLSTFIGTLDADSSHIMELTQVPPDTLQHMVMYLAHHKGVKPDPLPCPMSSIHMSEIVSDPWDATWIDAFEKKTIFEIILAANYLDIKSLLHLGSAKIATLIKQLDQREIDRIIEEEERYRREQAQAQNEQNTDDEDEDEDSQAEEDADDAHDGDTNTHESCVNETVNTNEHKNIEKETEKEALIGGTSSTTSKYGESTGCCCIL